MLVLRVLGYALLLAGLIVLGRDILAWHDTGTFSPVAFGPLWLELSRQSYVAATSVLAPWMLIILRRLLMLWAAATLLALGLVLALIGRRERSRRRRR
jgi:hypothetical protein